MYTKDELMPRTGHPAPLARGGNDSEASRRSAAFLAIYVANPVHRAPFEAMDRLRAATAGRRGTRQYALRVTGPSGSGKSTLAETFRDVVVGRGRHAAGERPCVYVELEQACTVKRMWSQILRAYGDGFPEDGTVDDLRRRALDEIAARRTDVLAIDEVQHLFYRSKDGLAATDAFKRLLDSGLVSLVLLGDEEGRRLLESNVQLGNRMVASADIAPLDAVPGGLATLAGFLKRYDARMLDHRLHDEPAGLDDRRTVAALMEASAGVMGVAVNIVREASDHAWQRAARRIEPFDLAHGAKVICVDQRRLGHNPFSKA